MPAEMEVEQCAPIAPDRVERLENRVMSLSPGALGLAFGPALVKGESG